MKQKRKVSAKDSLLKEIDLRWSKKTQVVGLGCHVCGRVKLWRMPLAINKPGVFHAVQFPCVCGRNDLMLFMDPKGKWHGD